MVANSACTVYRITTIKRGVVTHVAVDGGMGDNLEVSLTGQRFEAAIVNRETLCFVCGPEALVHDVPGMLTEIGIPTERIRVEEWAFRGP